MALLNAGRMAFRRVCNQRFAALINQRGLSDQADAPVVVTRPTGDDGILTIRLNKPKKFNAVDLPMYQTVFSQLNDANEDKDVKIVVLTGTGKFFSAGNDLSAFAKIDMSNPKEVMKFAEEGKKTMITFVDSLINLKKPIVAAVNGPAVGIFATTLALCDVIWAADGATFHTPFSSTAQSPEGVSSRTFPAALGPSLANEMLMFNRKITADEALRAGFVSAIFPTENFLESVHSKLREITSVSSAESMVAAKSLIRTDADREQLRAVNRIEADMLVQRWFSPEFPAFIMQFMSRKSQ
ncbi:Enoyl-CoA delta isomerase 2 [Halotydeus destructor]|nr:Enoyl-CoA delta isomerase 2 [Halotydeus destructor]